MILQSLYILRDSYKLPLCKEHFASILPAESFWWRCLALAKVFHSSPSQQTLSDGMGVILLIYFSSGQGQYPTTQKVLQGQYKARVCIVDVSDTLTPSCIPTHWGKSGEGQSNPLSGKTRVKKRCKLLPPAFVSLRVLPVRVALGSMVEGASCHGRTRSSISHSWIFASMSWGSWTHSASGPRLSSTASEVWWNAFHSSNINFYFSWVFFQGRRQFLHLTEEQALSHVY